MAEGLGVGVGDAGAIVVAAQLGYALGILLLVPLSDGLRPRRQIPVQICLSAGALLVAAAAHSLWIACIAVFLAGFFTNSAQIIVATVARHGPVSGVAPSIALIGSGVLVGIFGGRLVATIVEEAHGWRAVYVVFAVLALGAALWQLRLIGPDIAPENVRWRGAFVSTFSRALTRVPESGRAGICQGLVFVAFNSVWATVAAGIPGGGGAPAVFGIVVALVGLLTAGLVPVARRVGLRWALGSVVAGCVVLAIGSESAPAVVTGLLLVTLGGQVCQVTHQAALLRSAGDQAGAVNTLYLFIVFLGGAVGAGVGAALLAMWGFGAVALFATAAAVLSCLILLLPGERSTATR